MEITVHPGIGDLSWLISKLSTTGMKFKFRIAEDKKTKRAMPIVKMVDCIEDAYYGNMEDYAILYKCKNADFSKFVEAHEKGQRIFMTANWWVDSGNRLEKYLPDLDTDFHYPINGNEEEVKRAELLTRDSIKSVGIYTSSQGGIVSWNGWNELEWIDFIRQVQVAYPYTTFYIFGAGWDQDMKGNILNGLNYIGADYVDLIGKTTLGEAVELIRRMDYFAGYASGLTILSNVVYTPVLMLYPQQLKKLMYSWPCPMSIVNNEYVGRIWGRPCDTFHYIEDILEKQLSRS